ncbi:MAG: tetratricopeptide repeat protein, partial [Deltaproteobacteria bacterium]|nr:tetratricopeptide repeat protein [Deltaproteobacteria bacterium]
MSEIDRLYDIAVNSLRQGHYPQAIDYLRKVLSGEPDFAEAHAALSISLYNMKRLHAAQYEAGVALELEPDLPLAHYAMAWTMIGMRKFRKAKEHLDILLEIDPDDAENFRCKAHLLQLEGKKDDARLVLMEALELDPES